MTPDRTRHPGSRAGWFALVTSVFLGVQVIILGLAVAGIEITDIVRAYVAGEGHYSKAQKSAVYALRKYARTRDETDYERFLQFVDVNRGDRRARQILESPEGDLEAAYRGLMQGRNHPDDVAGMAWLFRTFGDTPLFAPPIESWRHADSLMRQLETVAAHLHTAVLGQRLDAATVASYLRRIDSLDQQLTAVENTFSSQMRHAAQRLKQFIYAAVGLTTVLLWSGALAFTWRSRRQALRAEQNLAESEKRTRGVIDRSLDAFISIDGDDRIIDWNPTATQTFGWSRSEALGRRLADTVIPPANRAQHVAGLRRFLEGGSGRLIDRRTEVQALHRDGQTFPAELSVHVQHTSHGVVFNAFVRDITDRRRAEAELRQAAEAAELANRSKTEFLANMSHELRTPLNAVIGFAEVMENEMLGPLAERYRDYVADIRQSGRHLLELINDILDISKIEAGRLELHEEVLDVQGVTENALRLLRERAQSAQVELINEIPASRIYLYADERRVKQILVNLTANAVKFSNPGGQVTISGRRDSDGLILQVADQGIGMSPEDVPKALRPFGQIDSGLARKHEGTGLGLPLVERLATLHGGSLEIDSAPGAGTTVTVRFPPSTVVDDPTGRATALAGQLPPAASAGQ